ncbi:MAG: hypothetical protein RL134_624 [Actinomycetota bacterium]
MSTRVRVGEVEVRVDADLTTKQLRSLLRLAAGIHVGLAEAGAGEERPPIGFTVITEREAEQLAEPPDYNDEE